MICKHKICLVTSVQLKVYLLPSQLFWEIWQMHNQKYQDKYLCLTHWGRVTHICVDKRTIIGSDNGLSPGRRQAIIWTNAWILLIGSLGTNCSEISIGIQIFSFKKMHLKMSPAKWRPFCPGLNVLISYSILWLLSVWFQFYRNSYLSEEYEMLCGYCIIVMDFMVVCKK